MMDWSPIFMSMKTASLSILITFFAGLIVAWVLIKLKNDTLKIVLDGIFTISTLVPAIGFAALALVLWFWYPLHKKKVDENVALLAELHNKED